MAGGRASTSGPLATAGSRVLSASQPSLPTISSVGPLRRVASLTSTERESAALYWQATLKERLGTPGMPPPPAALPSLYEGRLSGSAIRPASVTRHSVAPSSIGPSASVVAWFAQYQCEHCGRMPTSLEASYCFSCGKPLPLPRLPGRGSEASRVACNLGEVAAAAVMEASAEACHRELRGGTKSEPGATRPAAIAVEQPLPQRKPETSPKRRARPQTGQPVPPIPRSVVNHGKGSLAKRLLQKQAATGGPPQELPWATRESQVALWLGNIRPRRHE